MSRNSSFTLVNLVIIILMIFSDITGIPERCVFTALFDLIVPALNESPKLSKMSMLLMFFLKIRLNLFDEDIAYRFGVHPSTVSRNFH